MEQLDREMAAASRSTLDLVRSVATDTESLLRKELELAKQEMMEAITARAKRFALLGVAGFFGVFVLGFAGLAASDALQSVLEPWAARLVVALGFGILASVAVAFAWARRTPPLKPEHAAEEAKNTFKEEMSWVRHQLTR